MDITTRVNELLANGQSFCLATVTTSRNPKVSTGWKFILHEDGVVEAGFDILLLESTALEMAKAALKEKKRRLVETPGSVDLFLDIFEPEATLLICGAGHIALPLSRFASQIGFKVTVVDDRADFANSSRFPGCNVIADDFIPALRDIPMNSSTFAVVITRGHVHDVACLQEILNKQTGYLGLIGSRRRVRFVLQMLTDKGFPEQNLKQVFTPIGIPIGSESPEEIAISIIAEIICIHRKGPAQARLLRDAIGVDL